MCRFRLVALLSLSFLILCSNARGERVGFTFTGALQVFGTGTTTLFGISVPKNAPVTGTFSYDTTIQAVGGDPGVKSFHQHIHAGYTLNINDGAIRLVASDYIVTVANDLEREIPAETVDTFNIEFDSRFVPTPSPLMVNEVPWTGPTAYMKLELSWPWTTFIDPDEPKLTSDRPSTPGISSAANSNAGSSASSPRLFSVASVSSIAPLTGDYNRDGKLDASDYAEWQHAFGEAGAAYHYADGNSDGIVNAADYVVWRNAITSVSASTSAVLNVPEPTAFMLVFFALFQIGCRARYPM